MKRRNNLNIFGFVTVLLLLIAFGNTNSFGSLNQINQSTDIGSFTEKTMKERSLDLSTNYFIQNRGQIDSQNILFYSSQGNIFFTSTGVIYRCREMTNFDDEGDELNPLIDMKHPVPNSYHEWGVVLEYSFVGSNNAIPEGMDRCSWNTNYFKGSDPESWHTEIPTYKEIIYPDLWEGIDLVYRLTDGVIKYDMIIHPGADPSDILIRIEGAEGLSISQHGDLVIGTEYWDIVDQGLYTYYQDGSGGSIPCKFQLINEHEYSFSLEGYDKSRTMVIDPFLAYSTFIGGSDHDYGESIAVDPSKNSYIAGYTNDATTDFPTTSGSYDTIHNGHLDVFVTKLNSTGSSLIFSTFIGGNNNDYGYAIVVDSNEDTYITGSTASSDYPTTPGAYDTTNNGGFVTKLNSTGSSLIYSTFIKGTNQINSIAIDSVGDAFITGITNSDQYPITPGAYDTTKNGGDEVFVTKINTTGSSLLYSTYLGGNGNDHGYGVAIDSNGCAIVSGHTDSSNFPTTPGAYDTSFNGHKDVFVTKLNSTGSSLIFSTFIGGSNDDEDFGGIAIDSNGNTYVTGETLSTDYPTTTGAYETSHVGSDDVFVTKLNSTGSSLGYSTFIGGAGGETAYAIVVDSYSNAAVTGITKSLDYPMTNDAFDMSFNGGQDLFLSKLDQTGTSMTYSSYLGGSGFDCGMGISADLRGNLYFTGYTDDTTIDYPTTPGAYDTIPNGNSEVFVSKIDFTVKPSEPLNLNGSIGNGYINLTWQAPLNDGGADISDYILYRGTNPSGINKYLTLGNVTSYNDTSIENGGTYYYYIKSKNYIGESAPSDTIKVFDNTSPIIIVDLTNFTATTGDDFKIEVVCTDNVLVESVTVELVDEYENITDLILSEKEENKWSTYFHIPSDLLNSYSYWITAFDPSNNSAGIGGWFQVIDNDKPVLLEDKTNYPPTTGDKLNLSFDLYDNILVDNASVYIYNKNQNPNEFFEEYIELIHGDGNNWFNSIIINESRLIDLSFILGISDSSDNINIINLSDRKVIDNDPPILLEDRSQKVGRTGSEFNFSIIASDNIDIRNVSVEYWYSDGIKHWETMSLLGEGLHEWNASIMIDESLPFIFTNRTIIELNYSFYLVDTSGNEMVHRSRAVTINDTILPNLVSDLSDEIATTGDPFNFEIEVFDNIGIESVELHYGYRNPLLSDSTPIDFNKTEMIKSEGGKFDYKIILPIKGQIELEYRFVIKDVMGNLLFTNSTSILVQDNDPPNILALFKEREMFTGGHIDIWINATDNSDNFDKVKVKAEYWFSGNIEQIVLLNDRGTSRTYKTFINAPSNSIEPLHMKIHLFDSTGNENITQEILVEVKDNIPPTILPIVNITLKKGDLLDVTALTSDNIGIIEYRWEGVPIESAGPDLKGYINETGTYFIKITVFDEAGNSNTTSFKVVIEEPNKDNAFSLCLLIIIAIVLILIIIGLVIGLINGKRGEKEVWIEKEDIDELDMDSEGPEPPELEESPEDQALPPVYEKEMVVVTVPSPSPVPSHAYVPPDQIPEAPMPIEETTDYIPPNKDELETPTKTLKQEVPLLGKKPMEELEGKQPDNLLNP